MLQIRKTKTILHLKNSNISRNPKMGCNFNKYDRQSVIRLQDSNITCKFFRGICISYFFRYLALIEPHPFNTVLTLGMTKSDWCVNY